MTRSPRASGAELLGVLLAAYGLTAQERDVCREVPAGLSTTDIAARLAIAAHAVQDHLESVFGKGRRKTVEGRYGIRARNAVPLPATA